MQVFQTFDKCFILYNVGVIGMFCSRLYKLKRMIVICSCEHINVISFYSSTGISGEKVAVVKK